MKALSGIIFDIKRFSLNDGPGIRTTVFFKGCPLSCPWCHNPEGLSSESELLFKKARCIDCRKCIYQSRDLRKEILGGDGLKVSDALSGIVCNCPSKALDITGEVISMDQLIRILLRDREYYEQSGGGVTISGGEPLLQALFLAGLIANLEDLKISTAVETTLCLQLDKSTGYPVHGADLIILDLKLLESSKAENIGLNMEILYNNLQELVNLNKKLWIRIIMIKNYTDSDNALSKYREILLNSSQASKLKKLTQRIELLEYHKLGLFKAEAMGKKNVEKFETWDQETISDIKKELENGGYKVLLKKGISDVKTGNFTNLPTSAS
jgi:pyruvate formate lyase activating enzyme